MPVIPQIVTTELFFFFSVNIRQTKHMHDEKGGKTSVFQMKKHQTFS